MVIIIKIAASIYASSASNKCVKGSSKSDEEAPIFDVLPESLRLSVDIVPCNNIKFGIYIMSLRKIYNIKFNNESEYQEFMLGLKIMTCCHLDKNVTYLEDGNDIEQGIPDSNFITETETETKIEDSESKLIDNNTVINTDLNTANASELVINTNNTSVDDNTIIGETKIEDNSSNLVINTNT